MELFPSLKALEQYLTDQTGIKRVNSEKGKYSEYYKLFKGKGKKGINKKIEPIGVYNLTDALTPLFVYFLLQKEQIEIEEALKNKDEKDKKIIKML